MLQTSSSLGLRALLKAAAARSGMGAPAAAVTGPSASAAALLLASRAARGEALVAIVPREASVGALTTDIRFFLAALEGLSDRDVENAVLPFPSLEVDPYRRLAPHLGVASARARALHAAATGKARVIVASAVAAMPRLVPPERLLAAGIEIRRGTEIEPGRLAEILVDAGFVREDPVDQHGEFTIRGGVVDFFPAFESHPVRLEFIGDTVESIRRYDPATQRSTLEIDQVAVVPLRETFDLEADEQAPRTSSLFDYAAHGARPALFVLERPDARSRVEEFLENMERSYEARPESNLPPPGALFLSLDDFDAMVSMATRIDQLGLASEGSIHVPCQPAVSFHGRLADWTADISRARERGETVLFVAASSGRAERAIELLKDYEIRAVGVEAAEENYQPGVLVGVGRLTRGFRLPDAGLQVYAETDVFEEEARAAAERRPSAARVFLSDFRDLQPGDLVVHVDHGIGRFVGLRRIGTGPGDTAEQEFMEIRYAGDDKLFVPVERLDLVQKYTGGAHPPLDRLGGTTWERAKSRVRKAMRDMAEDLLQLYAARKAIAGHAFGPDTHWQEEFESGFEYELTPDQQTAIADIKRDMESPVPMDRLLCGDVGYGKTEVAMRAAFKAVMDGKQVAFLAPTTVLALQHYQTLTSRFAPFPVTIDMVSRFRSRAEQKATLANLASGRLDIIVGTHRLLSKDVQFRDLGLLVVDEEQRFGVAHKERIKQMRRKVDVLTMTATPIPRTLNMSLAGIRDMSIIETPPKDRLSIQTEVVGFDQSLVARAIRNELARGGQIYFVHNRVESIFSIASLVSRLVPEARLVVAHGQMGEDELERAMLDFVAHKYDILVATTIIENGLDIPNVNTIIVNRADRYGLAQLYQLRGRVGRSDRHAYAYLLVPPGDDLTPVARKRLAAIREFSDLGSGFRVAALDLEIRGAGNLLGGEQSGHIEAVGFEMYTKLLEQTVRELKGEEVEEESRAVVNLGVDIRIDESYMPEMNQRLMLYRRVAEARSEKEIENVLEEVRDRYGPHPPSMLNLADYGRIRVLADRLGIESIDRQASLVVFTFRNGARNGARGGLETGGAVEAGALGGRPGGAEGRRPGIDVSRLVQVLGSRTDLSLVPPASLKLDLKAAAARAAARAAGARGASDRPGSEHGGSTTHAVPPGAAGSGSLRSKQVVSWRGGTSFGGSRGRGRGGEPSGGPRRNLSWWTERATEREVTPGFTRDEILRPVREDPRGPAGVFTLVLGALSELVGVS